MPRLPPFAEPSTYLRAIAPKEGQFNATEIVGSKVVFIRLGPREGPLKYQWDFGALAAGVRSSLKAFGDFQLKDNHIAQVYMGITPGARARFYPPLDLRLLEWDDPSLDIQKDDTGNIEYEDSPVDDPRFNFWLAPGLSFVPAADVQNTLSDVVPARSINIQLYFLAALYQFEFVDKEKEPEIWDKLSKFQIPSKFVTFGGAV